MTKGVDQWLLDLHLKKYINQFVSPYVAEFCLVGHFLFLIVFQYSLHCFWLITL